MLRSTPDLASLRHDAEAVPARLSADKRREQLIGVAIDLFSRKGFKGTTTREIAAAAGVTEAIIFRHFETKEQLYKAIIDQKLRSPDTADWIVGFKAAMDRNDDEAVIRQLIIAIIETHKTDPKFERLMLYAALEGNDIALLYMRQITVSIIDAFRHYFLRRQEQGCVSPVGPDLALMAIVGMAQHYALNAYVHKFKDMDECCSDKAALEGFTQIVMDGLCVKSRGKTSKKAKSK